MKFSKKIVFVAVWISAQEVFVLRLAFELSKLLLMRMIQLLPSSMRL